jgi:hypothetical protein
MSMNIVLIKDCCENMKSDKLKVGKTSYQSSLVKMTARNLQGPHECGEV